MSENNNRWQEGVLNRFAGREVLDQETLYERYFKGEGMLQAEVVECLTLIESELGIPAGVLRPEDELDMLFEPIPTKNPLKWLIYQTRAGDRQAEIGYQLNKRLRRYGTVDAWT